MVHLLRSPATAHLHQHKKFSIDKSKSSTRIQGQARKTLAWGVPRGGTRQARRGVFTKTLAEDHKHPVAAAQASSPRHLLPTIGATWLPGVQAALRHLGRTTCKGALPPRPLSPEMPSASFRRYLYGGTIVISVNSNEWEFFLLSTSVATPRSRPFREEEDQLSL